MADLTLPGKDKSKDRDGTSEQDSLSWGHFYASTIYKVLASIIHYRHWLTDPIPRQDEQVITL